VADYLGKEGGMSGDFVTVRLDGSAVRLGLDGFGPDPVEAVQLSPEGARSIAALLIDAADALEKKNPEGRAPPG
jgi:hypothetical protein